MGIFGFFRKRGSDVLEQKPEQIQEKLALTVDNLRIFRKYLEFFWDMTTYYLQLKIAISKGKYSVQYQYLTEKDWPKFFEYAERLSRTAKQNGCNATL